MILINLLPHREAARKKRKEAFFAALGLSALVGGLLAVLVYGVLEAQISAQESRNSIIQSEITKLEAQIKDISALQSEISALRARQQSVENLQADRNQPVYLFTELAKQMPDGVYLTTLKQDNLNLAFQGVAQTNERVSELLRNLSRNSEWLEKPELVEITSGKGKTTVYNFTMRAQMKRPVTEQPADAKTPANKAQG